MEPAITLSVVGSLEAVLVAVQLEAELVRRGLLKVSGLVERKHAGGLSAVGVTLLVEEEKALAGLAGPCNNRVRDLGLLASQVGAKVLGSDWGVAEPELLLGESELPAELLAPRVFVGQYSSLLQ